MVKNCSSKLQMSCCCNKQTLVLIKVITFSFCPIVSVSTSWQTVKQSQHKSARSCRWSCRLLHTELINKARSSCCRRPAGLWSLHQPHMLGVWTPASSHSPVSVYFPLLKPTVYRVPDTLTFTMTNYPNPRQVCSLKPEYWRELTQRFCLGSANSFPSYSPSSFMT